MYFFQGKTIFKSSNLLPWMKRLNSFKKERICSSLRKLFPLTVDLHSKGDKTEPGRVASHDPVAVYLAEETNNIKEHEILQDTT